MATTPENETVPSPPTFVSDLLAAAEFVPERGRVVRSPDLLDAGTRTVVNTRNELADLVVGVRTLRRSA